MIRSPRSLITLLATRFVVLTLIGLTLFGSSTLAQETDVTEKKAGSELTPLELKDFRPQSMLKLRPTLLKQAKFPCIDIHTHFGFRLKGDPTALSDFVAVMNEHNLAMCNSLDAELGAVEDHLNFLKPYQERFSVFAHIDFQGTGQNSEPATWACNQVGFVRTVCEKLRSAKKAGIVGVKFFKSFGLTFKDAKGQLIKIDDPNFDPIWKTCGELKLPIIIHTGDPAAFFEPIDESNERYEELSRHPDWSFHGAQFPSRDSLLAARNRVIKRHPQTMFIGAHMAGNPEDLATVSQWLDDMPNLYIEFASRIAELGRQPYTARKFLIQHQDRVLFGTDGPWPELRLTYYWRFLETFDENFAYSEKTPPPQGLWNIHGLNLPDSILEKIYFKNTLDLLPNLATKYDAACRALAQASKLQEAGGQVVQTEVFTAGDNDYHTFRIPAVVKAANGDLIAFCEGRKNASHDTGDIDIVSKRSQDGGRTWSSLTKVWDDGKNTCGNPCPVLDRTTGTLWLLLTWNDGSIHESKIKPGYGENSRRVFVAQSSDHGNSWTQPLNITSTTKAREWSWYATGPGAGIQIAQGPHAGRMVIPCDHKVPTNAGVKYYSHSVYSDDHGKTWLTGGSSPRDKVNECEVVELSDHRLLLNMRNYDRSQPTRQTCVSDDGGMHWSQQRHDDNLTEPTCQASLRRFSWPTDATPGIILFSNPASTKDRKRLTLRASLDDCQSWPFSKVLYAGPSAYSCLTEIDSKTFGCFYERDNYQKITFARVPINWLIEKK